MNDVRPAISPSSYDAAEKWCHEIVSQGHDMLFDPIIFEQEIRKACDRFQFQLEVSSAVSCWCDTLWFKNGLSVWAWLLVVIVFTFLSEECSSCICEEERLSNQGIGNHEIIATIYPTRTVHCRPGQAGQLSTLSTCKIYGGGHDIGPENPDRSHAI